MKRFGFIHDKLDIKILILFILGRLEAGVDLDVLAELSLCDDGISYFDFSDCVAELTKSGHVREEEGLYFITEKGLRNGRATESSLPYSVRRRAEKSTEALAVLQRRDAMIKAEKYPREGGGFTVKLALHDGLGEILALDIYAANETQAGAMVAGFSKRAEQIYSQIVEIVYEA